VYEGEDLMLKITAHRRAHELYAFMRLDERLLISVQVWST
jgi:hypothetical protein